jgi:membrane protease YdiL (CAAX protease family)
MQTKVYKISELVIIFIFIPVSFAIDYAIWLKMTIGTIGFLYVLFVLMRVEKIKFEIAAQINWRSFLQRTFSQLVIIAVLTTLYMWFVDRQNLYMVVLNKPLLWLAILFFYSLFSVYPQELIYRTLFFKRYQSLVKNEMGFILLNAALFSLAHLFFGNVLVMVLTFVGGLLFALTYKKTKSTLLVSLEHAIYGCWLFTVGMGDMLGFPS